MAGKTSTHTSQPFDNSAVAGGFVEFHAAWGLQASERDEMMKALKDDASVAEELCLELELCRVSGDATRAHTAVSSIASACFVMLITAVLTQPGPAGPGVDEAAGLPQPDTDLVVGIWRLPLKDLSVGGDLKAHSATIQAAAPLGPIRPLSPLPSRLRSMRLFPDGTPELCVAC